MSLTGKIQAWAALFLSLAIVAGLGSYFRSSAQGPAMNGPVPPATWRPNKRGARYVGPQACTRCHQQEAATQHTTAMGKALEPGATSEILRANPRLSFRSGPYAYEIIRQGDQSFYSVSNEKETIKEPILYSFGQGKAGQTYVFQHQGSFYESRLSFYREIRGLDWTLGYPRTPPLTLKEAAGRAISNDEARNCFTCHATAATNGLQLQLDRLIPGVTCEACHGPGGDHIDAMEAKADDKRIFNAGNMSSDELSQEFCGSCHRSAEDVAANLSVQGINTVRFQPYRLFTSRGHDPLDTRLSCTACHNPHEDPKHESVFYDDKCFACHRSSETGSSPRRARFAVDAGRDAKPCPKARRLCVSCHMPKVEIPGSHFRFTDHRIRITAPGEPFPN